MKNQTGLLVILGLFLLCLVADAYSAGRNPVIKEIGGTDSFETLIEYEGPTAVMLDQKWSLTCSGIPLNRHVLWKLNGTIPRKQLSNGLFTVIPGFVDLTDLKNLNMTNSTLISWKAQRDHEGFYTCLDGEEGHFIKFVEEKYEGPKKVEMAKEFEITCTGVLPGSQISWKLNDKTPEDLTTGGLMTVLTDYDDEGMIKSTLTSLMAHKGQEGFYSCVPSLKPHHIKIVEAWERNH